MMSEVKKSTTKHNIKNLEVGVKKETLDKEKWNINKKEEILQNEYEQTKNIIQITKEINKY